MSLFSVIFCLIGSTLTEAKRQRTEAKEFEAADFLNIFLRFWGF